MEAVADPLFTAIIDTYYRPAWLRHAAEALLGQTYGNIELILVDNGSTPETKACLKELKAADPRVKLVEFAENQYSLDDPLKMLDTCLNAGLRASTGELVWYQADDDYVSKDYTERMVRLFRENADCVTAAGLSVAVDPDGRILDKEERRTNFRPRHMPGRELALRYARGERRLFSSPGTIFTVRRAALEKAGGFHRELELLHQYCIAPTGDTGFDEEARFYWRRHGAQLNKTLNARGWIGINESRDFIARLRAHAPTTLTPAEVEEIAGVVEGAIERSAGAWFFNNLLAGNPAASWRLMSKMGATAGFWRHALRHAGAVIYGKSDTLAKRLGFAGFRTPRS